MVYLKQNEHANLDSLPLRFGFYFPENKVLELFNCKEQKLLNKESQIGPEYRLIASFKDINNEEHDATFILLDDNKKLPYRENLMDK